MSVYDESAIKDLGGGSTEKKSSAARAPSYNWSSMPIDVLIKYRDEITSTLPPLTLAEMNLEEEMLLQFHSLRSLQNEVLNDDDQPLNQRAQVANATAASLNKLADLQESLYSSERFKMVERLLIRALRKLPEDVASAFLDDYEASLAGVK